MISLDATRHRGALPATNSPRKPPGAAGASRSKSRYSPLPGDISYIVPVSLLKETEFCMDSSGKFLNVKQTDALWPSIDTARRGDVLVAVDGRSTLLRKSFPKILMYLNKLHNRRAYELTFRLPQVALDARPPLSTRTQFDPLTGNVEGYLNKLSQGGMFSKPKWEIRYFVLNHAKRELFRYKTRPSPGEKGKGIPLADVKLTTEDVEQPAIEDTDGSVGPFKDSFVTRFDFDMKDGTSRSFIAHTPEDCRVWVAAITSLTNQNVLTDEPLEALNDDSASNSGEEASGATADGEGAADSGELSDPEEEEFARSPVAASFFGSSGVGVSGAGAGTGPTLDALSPMSRSTVSGPLSPGAISVHSAVSKASSTGRSARSAPRSPSVAASPTASAAGDGPDAAEPNPETPTGAGADGGDDGNSEVEFSDDELPLDGPPRRSPSSSPTGKSISGDTTSAISTAAPRSASTNPETFGADLEDNGVDNDSDPTADGGDGEDDDDDDDDDTEYDTGPATGSLILSVSTAPSPTSVAQRSAVVDAGGDDKNPEVASVVASVASTSTAPTTKKAGKKKAGKKKGKKGKKATKAGGDVDPLDAAFGIGSATTATKTTKKKTTKTTKKKTKKAAAAGSSVADLRALTRKMKRG